MPMSPRLLRPKALAPSGFDPRSIAGLTLWMDASDSSTMFDATSGGSLVAADGAVARWEDKSGNGKHFTQGVANNRPTRKVAVQGGKDVLRFNGTTNRLDSASAVLGSGATPVTLLCAIKFSSFTSFPEILEVGNNPRVGETTVGYQFIAFNDGAMYCSNLGGNNQRYTAASALSAATWYALSYNSSGAAFSSSNPKFWRNGSTQASTRGTGTGTPNITASHVGRIGANLNGTVSQFLNGDIGELLAYTANLSDAERQAVENYLLAKWAIT